jgi:hypothetical protein
MLLLLGPCMLDPRGHRRVRLYACRRGIGGDKIPEFWGKPSAYTEGTGFLGTPKDHLNVSDAMQRWSCLHECIEHPSARGALMQSSMTRGGRSTDAHAMHACNRS